MLQTLIADERKNRLLLAYPCGSACSDSYACGSACSDSYRGGISSQKDHATQCDNIRYLLTWIEGEIWVIQRTSGHDTSQCLSRVVRVLLHMLVGSAIPLIMQLMQKDHPVPLRATRYHPGGLIREVLDTFTYATCRDFPSGSIDFKVLKADILLEQRPGGSTISGSRQIFSWSDVNDQNGRVGNSCSKCLNKFPDAFLFNTGRVKSRRRNRPAKSDLGPPCTGAPAGEPTDEPMDGPHDSAVAAA